jgi:enoyl-CoA hydratase/3-hydroxyacyl-CoA dehydrogenase
MGVWARVINEAAKMVQHDVATVEDVDTGMKLRGNWPVGHVEKADAVGAEAVVRTCIELAGMHERIQNLGEVLPCDLLVETAKAGETFY